MFKQNNSLYSQSELNSIRWKCRRGMLELDELLQTFFDKQFLTLTYEEQRSFVEFLSCSDQELFSWLMGFQPSQPQWSALINKIRNSLK
jgi:antitoxin CptB